MQSYKFYTIAAVFSLLFTFTVFTNAQTPTPTPTPPPPPQNVQEDTEVLKVDSRLVVVPVSVTDSAGQPVQGLAANDFRIAEEGKQQTIDHVGDAA